jgi:hypothetical protein
MQASQSDQFNIQFTSNLTGFIFDEECLNGLIKIGSFSEAFNSPVDYWTKAEYIKQWVHGLRRLLFEEGPSCLVTAMRDPSIGEFINIWPLYKRESKVLIQNQIIFCKDLNAPIEYNDLYKKINLLELVCEDGYPISTWEIQLDKIRSFYEELLGEKGS